LVTTCAQGAAQQAITAINGISPTLHNVVYADRLNRLTKQPSAAPCCFLLALSHPNERFTPLKE